MGVAGTGILTAWFSRNRILSYMVRQTDNTGYKLTRAPMVGDDVCVLTPSQTEGPFFFKSPIRADIREDREGAIMQLDLQLIQAPDCKPVEGALVEIWQCDADGNYSGYPEGMGHNLWKSLMWERKQEVQADGHIPPVNENLYLRGAQPTDANGMVHFTTIFPGWYEPRVPHIHFKVITDDREFLTSQFYFDPAFCDELYLVHEPYKKYGSSPFLPENDIVIHDYMNAEGLQLNPSWEAGQLRASARIGIPVV